MKKELRYYQKEACRAIVESWDKNEIPCISVMTALGKSLIASALTEWSIRKDLRVLCLVPTFELVKQNHEEMVNFISKPEALGIVCNQLQKMQLHKQVVVAMYQSFYTKRLQSGKFDVLIIDEAHLVSNNPLSQYRKIVDHLLTINPEMKICGMTASPYRLGQGLLTKDDIAGKALFTSICYDTSVYPGIPRLVEERYLARIEIANTHDVSIDLTGIKMSGNEFNQVDVGMKFDKICEAAVTDMRRGFENNSIETALIFVSSIKNAEHVLAEWGDTETMRLVSSESFINERKENTEWFKNGKGKRYLVNVGILTTGFNFPSLQAVVLMRATTSPGLLIQMLGRLIRPYGDMTGLVWDYGSNIERLGGIDDIKIPKGRKEAAEAPKKLCILKLEQDIEFEGIHYKRGQNCYHENRLSAKKCDKCGGQFIAGEEGKYTMRTQGDILAEKEAKKEVEWDVDNVEYSLVQRRDGEWAIERFFSYEFNFVFKDQLRLNGTGFVKEHAERFLLGMMTNKSDFYKLGDKGRTSEHVHKLLMAYPQFFLKPCKLWLKNNGKYTNIAKMEYKNETN